MEWEAETKASSSSCAYFSVFIPQRDSEDIAFQGPVSPGGDLFTSPISSGSTDQGHLSQNEEAMGEVFTSQPDAMAYLKKHKKLGARYKRFETREEATNFASGMSTNRPHSPHNSKTVVGSLGPGGDASVEGDVSLQKPDESLPFPSLAATQFSLLKRAIEKGDLEQVRRLVTDNPRYLVAGGDIPTIVVTGCRYNALHIAARSGETQIFKYVLDCVSDWEFLDRLFPKDTDEQVKEARRRFLVQCYLNTPDKSLNETPLHFASKLGFSEIVKLVTSYPECDRQATNKYGNTAADLACTKSKLDGEELARSRQQITESLDESLLYIALYRPWNYSGAPILEPPSTVRPPLTLKQRKQQHAENKPVTDSSTLLLEYRLAAAAGPLNSIRAEKFYRIWRSADGLTTGTTIRQQSQLGPLTPAHIKRSDIHKGMERVGRNLAHDFDCQWKEFWTFLGGFCDLRSDEGLKQLEAYLMSRKQVGTGGNCADALDHSLLAGTGMLVPLKEPVFSPFDSPLNAPSSSKRRRVSGTKSAVDRKKDSVPMKLKFEDAEDEETEKHSPSSTQHKSIPSAEDMYEDAVEELTGEEERSDMSVLADMLSDFHLYTPHKGGEDSEESPTLRSEDFTTDKESSGQFADRQTSEDSSDFGTPPSTPPALYLGGMKPTKMDLDVFLAIEHEISNRDEFSTRYPNINTWAAVMRMFTAKERTQWPALDSAKAKQGHHSRLEMDTNASPTQLNLPGSPSHKNNRVTGFGMQSPLAHVDSCR